MALQIRRGTDAERKLTTFATGEIVYTTDTKKVFVGDGSTLGGKFVGGFAESGLRTVVTPDGQGGFDTTYETEYTADGHLKLGGNDLSDIGNFGISGLVSSSLTPSNSLATLGDLSNRWSTIYATTLNISNTVNANTAGTHTGNVKGNTVTNDLSIVLNAESREFRGNLVADNDVIMVNWASQSFIGTLEGSVYGSVYGGDSTVVLDSFAQVLKLAPRTSEPSGATVGMIAVADNDSWDPAGVTGGVPYPVFFNGTDWIAFATTP